MRILLTGANGFVGPYLAETLRHLCESDIEIIATAKDSGAHALLGPVIALDVTDRVALETAIGDHLPTHVIHLAGMAATTAANADPEAAWRVHLRGTLDLAHAIMQRAPDCWLIHVGSGMVYGESAKAGRGLNENALLAPLDEYSATKAAADLALGALTKSGLKCIRLRPFNHTGPGQSEAFVVPAFAMQIARIEAHLAPPIIRVGNLDAQRDFLDVRDVANAYALVVRNVERLGSGTVLNIASGIPRRISEFLDVLVAKSQVAISVKQDPARQRSGDLPIMVGDAGRARKLLNWKPEHSFDDTLTAVLDDCRARVAHVGKSPIHEPRTARVTRHIDDANGRKRAPIVHIAAVKPRNGAPERQSPKVSHSIFWWPLALVRGLIKIIIVSLGRPLAKRRWSATIGSTVLAPFPALRERIRKIIATGSRSDQAPSDGIKAIADVVRRLIAALARRGLSRFPILRKRIEDLVAIEPDAPAYESDTYTALIVASKKWNFSKRLGGQ